MKELLNAYIDNVYINEDDTILAFVSGGGKIIAYETSGDCCSTCWFESISNPENLINTIVLGIEIKTDKSPWSILSEDEMSKYGCLDRYGYTIKTEKGYSDIEYRNDSNGYYGGSCTLIEGASIADHEKDIILSTNGQPFNMISPSHKKPVNMTLYKDK